MDENDARTTAKRLLMGWGLSHNWYAVEQMTRALMDAYMAGIYDAMPITVIEVENLISCVEYEL